MLLAAFFHLIQFFGVWVFPKGISKTLLFWVRGYPKLGDTQNTVTEPPKGNWSEKGTSCLIASVISLKKTTRFFHSCYSLTVLQHKKHEGSGR